jgi:cold shock CspA family protein
MDLSEAESSFKSLSREISNQLENIRSEEDSKIQIITRVINECLGWPIKDFRAETHHENGFSDYILVENEEPIFLVEAKRIGVFEVKTADKDRLKHLKINGSTLTRALDGIEQAASYSLTNGIPIAVLTDGIKWIVFKSFVTGSCYKSKEAVVFPSLKSIENDFTCFYELLSKECFGRKFYNRIFDSIHNKRVSLEQKLLAPNEESDILLLPKSDLAFSLDGVFARYFSKLTGAEDEKLLVECFVETNESRIADFSLAKMTANVLGNITPGESVDTELANLIKVTISTEDNQNDSGHTIFVVGPTGSGKTTFLERFFKKTLHEKVKKQCVLLAVDCLTASGDDGSIINWLIQKLIEKIEKTTYEKGHPEWEHLRGLYYGEYQKKKDGVDKKLYEKDPDEFRLKFSNYLEEQVENDREGYLKRLLEDIVANRHFLPVIVVDNTDEFSPEYKEKIFQFFQSIKIHINHCLLIFPVTDKSAWSFSKSDIYGIYKSKSFFLPTPDPKDVFLRRVKYLKSSISNEKQKGFFWSSTGVKIEIADIEGFANVLENIFVNDDYTSKTIGELTNYNIRRTLILAQRVITSPVLGVEYLIKSYITGDFVSTDFGVFMNALIRGDYEVYKATDAVEIFPIFNVDPAIRQSPLLNVRVLALLESVRINGKDIEGKHLKVQSIVDYFDVIGCSEISVDFCLTEMLFARLIEPFDASSHNISKTQKLAISFKGTVHLRLAVTNSVFFYQMALTTRIKDTDLASQIKRVYDSNISEKEKLGTNIGKFASYLTSEDKLFVNENIPEKNYDSQATLLDSLSKFSSNNNIYSGEGEIIGLLGDQYQIGMIRKNVEAVVYRFDRSKGYGFLEANDFDSRIFFHSNQLRPHGTEALYDGDKVTCDVGRSDKGFYVAKVHSIDSHEAELVDCKIIRIFKEREYGFAQLIGSPGRDAFFHFSVFSSNQLDKIEEGDVFRAEVRLDNKQGYQVKRIECFEKQV